MSDNHIQTNPDPMAAKKKASNLMDDATFAKLCQDVPDIDARYRRIVDAYYAEQKLSKVFKTKWQTLVTNELPANLSVQEWLSLVTNYKIKVRMAPKKVPEKPKPAPNLFEKRPIAGQLTIF